MDDPKMSGSLGRDTCDGRLIAMVDREGRLMAELSASEGSGEFKEAEAAS
jgi:hypothetical protein